MTTTTIDLAALDWANINPRKRLDIVILATDDQSVQVHCATCLSDIDLTDPIWQSALPILLRHVAGEGEGT